MAHVYHHVDTSLLGRFRPKRFLDGGYIFLNNRWLYHNDRCQYGSIMEGACWLSQGLVRWARGPSSPFSSRKEHSVAQLTTRHHLAVQDPNVLSIGQKGVRLPPGTCEVKVAHNPGVREGTWLVIVDGPEGTPIGFGTTPAAWDKALGHGQHLPPEIHQELAATA